MFRRILFSPVLAAFVLALYVTPSPAHNNRPSLMLHVTATQGTTCQSVPSLGDLTTAMPEAGDYTAYVVVDVPDDGYTGMDHFNFGAWYEQSGIQVTGWHSCTPREYPSSDWLVPGGDITLVWESCEMRSTFVAGWFDVTANGPGTLSLTGGDDRTVWMAGCGLRSFPLDTSDLGWVSLAGGENDGDRQGCNPHAAGCYYSKLPPVSPYREPRENAIILHVAPDAQNTCYDAPTSSEQVITKASADPGGARYNVYVIGVPQASEVGSWGLAGLEFGIDYQGGAPGSGALVVHSWTSCSDLEWSGDNWPNSGTGNMLTWVSPENCQLQQMVPAGYFTVSAYAPSSMALVPHPISAAFKVANCDGAEKVLENHVKPARVGWISMGGGKRGTGTLGCNPLLEPCDIAPTPAEPTTWGRVKALYQH